MELRMRLQGMYPKFASAILIAGLFSGKVTANKNDLDAGGKLLLTNGVTSIDGSSRGGLVTWSVIAG